MSFLEATLDGEITPLAQSVSFSIGVTLETVDRPQVLI